MEHMNSKPAYQDESLDFRERAEDLVSKMTIEECASQMLYGSARVERLGIEYYNWWNEALHGIARAGMATVFPQAIGLAATFDTALIYQVADVVSTEGRAKYNAFKKQGDFDAYKGLTYWTPNVNIFRDPRWGRGQETYGEDPYLTSRMGVAFVHGLQQKKDKHLKSAACAKHFAVHSGPESKRHCFDAVVSKKDLAETYLPAFESLVCEAGVEGMMGAYNRVNGEPCCGSKTLLRDILRDKWGFDGYVTSDCGAISDFHKFHFVTHTATESVALAIENGCDLNCGTMYAYLLETLQEGLITEEQIRQCAVHLMTTKMKLGMFDEKTSYDDIPYSVVDCKEHRELNYKTASESLILLKNNGLLPLDSEKLKNILVTGPNANSIFALEGNYHGTANECKTVLDALREALPNVRINYSRGCHLYKDRFDFTSMPNEGLSEIDILAEDADAVVVVVGFDETMEGEEIIDSKEFTGDRSNLLLPNAQRELVKKACQTGKPVIIVCMTGCAVDLEFGNEGADAIIHAWYPGAEGGKAIADLILGKFSPSGHLPVTFYYNENKLPDFEDYAMEGRTYKFLQGKPLYPFGYGLSYTKFKYTKLVVLSKKVNVGEIPVCRVTVNNTGKMAGREVVQLYLKDDEASVRVPHWKLCAVASVKLKPQETAEVTLKIDELAFCIIDDEGNYIREPGTFTLYVGGGQPDERTCELMGNKLLSEKVELI